MENISLSIIIPVYNAEITIKALLDKLIKQYKPNMQIIIVNDGSVDNSHLICSACAEKFPFVQYIQQINSGVSAARNTGISYSKGKFIVFIDSDDDIKDNYIGKLIELCTLNADLVQLSWEEGNSSEGYDKVLVCDKEYYLDKKSYLRLLFQQKLNTPWNKIYKKDIITGNNILFDTAMKVGEDIAFTLDYIKHAKSIFLTDLCLYRYTVDSKGLTYSVNPSYLNYTAMLQNKMLILNKEMEYNDKELAKDIYDSCLRSVFRTIGLCVQKNFNSNEISQAVRSSGILKIINSVKYKEFVYKVRVFLINHECYRLIGKIIRKRIT